MSTPGNPAGLKLDPLPDAVVVDANLWGNGILDLARLTKLAENAAKAGVEVWVPTQVALEWASHAHDDIELIRPSWKRLRRAHVVDHALGLATDVSTIADELTEQIGAVPNVKLLSMGGDAAVAGLRDQILGTGPGTRLRGVKTGAVDSSFVRDALAEVDNDPQRLVFVSGNASDLQAVAKYMGIETLIIRNEETLPAALFLSMSAPSDVQKYVAGEFLGLATVSTSTSTHAYVVDSSAGLAIVEDGDIKIVDANLFDVAPFEVTSAQVNPGYFTLVGIRNMEIFESAQGDPHSGSVDFEAILTGSVNVSGYEVDADGELAIRSVLLGEVLIVVPFTTSIESNAASFSLTGPGRAEDLETRFSDGYEALEWLQGLLSSLVGIEVIDDADLLDDGPELRGANDRTIVVERSGDIEEWDLLFDLGTAVAEISCRYDPGARVWAGKDSFDMFPPFYLHSTAGVLGSAPGPYEAIAAIWRYLVEPT